MITFTVPGEPVAKARPRITLRGHAYTPLRTVRAESDIKLFAARAMAGRDLFDEPLFVSVIAVFLPPASRTKKAAAAPNAMFRCVKPDLDNLIKTLFDACNGVVWQDDARIAVLQVSKIYGARPELRVSVKPCDPREWPFESVSYVDLARANARVA